MTPDEFNEIGRAPVSSLMQHRFQDAGKSFSVPGTYNQGDSQ
jgi:hypothetical protein